MYETKSLKEQIAEVVKNGKSVAARCKVLVDSLKLSHTEALMLVNMHDKANGIERTKGTRASNAFTFGVEIECLVPERRVREAFAANRVPMAYERYNHVDNAEGRFKFVSDASIIGADAIECVTPVLNSKDGFAKLKAAVKALNDAGAKVNRSTGLHVHVSTKNLTAKQYINTFINYAHLQDLIDTFLAPSRRKGGASNRWCKRLNDDLYWLNTCNTFDDVASTLCNERYFAVNPMAYGRHKTIEFRQHQGSTDYDKIANWARFCAKLVLWSAGNRLDHDVTCIDDIPFIKKAEKEYFKGRQAAFRNNSVSAA